MQDHLHSSRTPDTPTTSLLQRLKKNDEQAWQQLLDIFGPTVCGWAEKKNLQNNDAMDVVQEVFRAVHRKMDKFRRKSPDDTFVGWLRTITKTRITDLFRARGKLPLTWEEDHLIQDPKGNGLHECDSSDGKPLANSPLFRMVDSVRSDFPEETWFAYSRTEVDGVPVAQVAKELGITPNAVRKRRYRVKARLKEVFGDLHPF